MACSAIRSPVLRNSTVRHYAAAAVAQCSNVATPELQLLPNNKVTVAALDNNNPVAQVSIIFRAGSRNETYDTQGTAHHIRIAAGLSTCRSTYFGITRNIQQLGGNLTATTDRESIAYTLQITRNNLDKALTFLEDVATKQVFKPWEISDQLSRLRYELSMIPEATRIMELLHKAAYRTGLGYSLYSPKRQLGKINTETLQHFVNTWFTGSRCAVVATGVSLSDVTQFASNLKVGPGDNIVEIAKYRGGELRKERSSELSTVAVAVEAAGLNKEKDALACAVLQRAIGSGPRVKWGSSVSPLKQAVSGATSTDQFALSAFNVSYSDSGLFGLILSSVPNVAGSVTKAATEYLRSPKLSEADVVRGKTMLKAEILYAADNDAMYLENMGQQAIIKGRVYKPSDLVAEVDKITASEVKSVAGKLAGGKLSMAAIGNLCTVPYIDELK
ncbi:Cytochrome b-c1 complex subunit 2, mitochondrial [Trachymyrmex zeteki]|uniref:Cytochrome b-c1 complex subunit 2, mitochondrial n=1 Tax=Mycetomoellerius zeteki TaxID=64791 RepID=A0A151WFQ3_9HYME|nr:PREDICTED: cytochrome b-c1 complex subunit 2, mitochondrial [Trachymyrmex zeteki]KYQ46670.1 Cytochrome b-c1 complex subunit 2, mitochondrial [Trachymyrmex zeteki]